MSRRKLATLTAAGFLAAVPLCAMSAANQSAPATAAASIESVRASSLNCSSPFTAPYAQVQGAASVPVCANDTWIYDVPASRSPDSVRRTETHWGTGNAIVQYREGQTVDHEAIYTGELGQAGQDDDDWHVLWQMHGPFKNGAWHSPALSLSVRHGQVRLVGGSGHPNQDWKNRNYEWVAPLTTWTDGKPVRVRVRSYLSSDPSRGWVSAWVDGRQVLNQWHPTSYRGGNRPGTFYPGMDYVVSRNGLYRGSQGATSPTYRQVVSVRLLRAG
ncbi:heparin lyase I family protein [Gephyromycinifex aptenodytis]|uniref:heparin lyase I family protein n=1 Tax=Gephyromycinifex aptenodytis TaxID=2716227 RepID=UPI001447446A|nr:heparin lyase I family protein [Gephyromycinifex aptenodytis]